MKLTGVEEKSNFESESDGGCGGCLRSTLLPFPFVGPHLIGIGSGVTCFLLRGDGKSSSESCKKNAYTTIQRCYLHWAKASYCVVGTLVAVVAAFGTVDSNVPSVIKE